LHTWYAVVIWLLLVFYQANEARPPDVAQTSLTGGVLQCVECVVSPVHTVSEMMNTDRFIN